MQSWEVGRWAGTCRRMTAPDIKLEGQLMAATCLRWVFSIGQVTAVSTTIEIQRLLCEVQQRAGVSATAGRDP